MKLSKLLIVLLSLTLLFGCANETPNEVLNEQTVTLSVRNSKTITPGGIQPVATYVFTLESTTNPENNRTAESNDGKVTIEKVALGNYKVNVKGYSDKEKTHLVQEGNSDTDLVVSLKGENSTTIQMHLITTGENLKGAIKIPVDITNAITDKNFAQALEDGIRFELYIDNELIEDASIILTKSDFPENKKEITFDNIPVGVGKLMYIKLYNKETGQLLIRNFFTSIANIYAGQTSIPDVNDQNSGVINPNSIVSASNITGLVTKYNDAAMDTAIDLTWNNPQQNGKNLAKEITFKYTSADGVINKKTITYTEENADNDSEGKTTLEGLTPGASYTLSYSLKYFNGMHSQERTLPYKLTPYVFVTALTIDEKNIPTTPIYFGQTFATSATVMPENATNSNVKWESSDSEILSGGQNGLFEAKKPGKATITAKTEGFKNSQQNVLTTTLQKEIAVILKTPTLHSEVVDHAINLSWDEVPYAEEYALYEIVDGGEAQLLATITAPTTTYVKDSGIIAGAKYEYYLVAKAPSLDNGDFKADSAQSSVTEAVTPVVPNISVIDPTLNESHELEFGKESVERVITPDNTELRFVITNANPEFTYAWYINGTKVESSIENGIVITKESDGIYKDASTTFNTLMLVATSNTNPSHIISATTTFEVVEVLDTGVEVFINGEKDGKRFIPTSANTVSLNYQVLPEDASNQNVTFSSSNEEVATIDENGIITIKQAGDTTITIKPAHGEAATIPFKFYAATFDSPLAILNEVNAILREHITAANTQFGGDWYYLGAGPTYTATGVTIKAPNTNDFSKGHIKLTNLNHNGLVLNTTTDIIPTYKDEGLAGIGGTDPLLTIGYENKGDLKVDLPSNQGSVTIHYSNINVYGTERSGQYTLTFEPIAVGDKSYKLFNDITITDDASVTRLFN